jgi:putative hydrolase of the HAD superfamily
MYDWSKIDTVLLDMDGTLLDLHFDNYFWRHHLPAAYARKHGHTLSEAEQIVFAQFSDQQATLNWYCLDYWSRQLDLDVVALKREMQYLIAIRPGAIEFLQFLQRTGKRTVLVTNAHRDSLDLKMERTGIGHLFDRLISAHDLGHPKEHPAFWQTLSIAEPYVPARTIFIDDTFPVLDAAKKAGIAFTLGIVMPDSKGDVRSHPSYPLVGCFSELWT